MLKIQQIDERQYFNILKLNNINIPIWSDKEAVNCYKEKELLKVYDGNEIICVFLVPLNNNGVRRKYRFFPYISPIFLKTIPILKKKEILKFIFEYLFNKYEYCFIPLHPDFKVIASISSLGGFVEMRHTHVINKKLELSKCTSKLRNHINSANNKVIVEIGNSYHNYDFSKAIKGNELEIKERSNLAKNLLDNKKAITITAKYEDTIIAGLVVTYDNEWAYLLHSYQDKTIRGVIPLLIYKAINYCFDNLNIKYFDFEGSVIDEIDNFFSTFNVEVVTYPYLIEAKDDTKLFELIKRSMNIEGRINR